MPGMATLVLLDGHSLAYRAFYALPTDLATKAGTVTNAVFGFTSMLVKLMSEEKPEYLAVAFDAPVRTFRYDLDPEYKAGRKETPQLFASQMPLIRGGRVGPPPRGRAARRRAAPGGDRPPVPAVRRAPRRQQRQPARGARHRRE